MWCTISHFFVWTQVMLQSRHSRNILWYEETAEKVGTARIWGSRPSRLHFTLGEKFVLPLQNYLWVKYHFRLYFSHQILPPSWDTQRWVGWSVHFLDWTEEDTQQDSYNCRAPALIPWLQIRLKAWALNRHAVKGLGWHLVSWEEQLCLAWTPKSWAEAPTACLLHRSLSLRSGKPFPSREVTSCTTATELENDIWNQAF